MKTRFPCMAIVAVLMAVNSFARAGSEIAIAIRYLQPKGTSHSQLFLYREDGTLLRQLTKEDSGQVTDPVFAPDGETIVFTREKGGAKEYWSVEPKGDNLRKLDSAPQWYAQAKGSPFFTYFDPESTATSSPSPQPVASPSPDSSAPEEPAHFTTPDGMQEIILKIESDENDDYDGSKQGQHYILKDLKTGKSVEMGKLPGFFGLFELLHLDTDTNAHFLVSPPMRLAFFGRHLNSTDGDTTFALDLNAKKIVRLSPNWACPIPLDGEPAFLTFTFNRYVPIPGSQKTANCSYLEHWDVSLNKIRYARPGTAAICYGASMYRPGKTPVTIRNQDE